MENLILEFTPKDYFAATYLKPILTIMLPKKNKDLDRHFLKCLSKIKGWNYHDKIETEKKSEINEFISFYILRDKYGEIPYSKISFKRLNFFVEHPNFKPLIKALLVLLEPSCNEQEFNERFEKARVSSAKD